MNKNIKINGKILPRYGEILSEEALKIVQEIHEQFNKSRLELLNESFHVEKQLSFYMNYMYHMEE